MPTPREVLGFDLGEREVTAAESDRYLDAVARSSDRVVPGTLATSWQGRPLRYAIVGNPDRVTRAGLADARRRAALLRNPHTPAALARLTARHSPLILWVTANVHGNEESGTDAALRTLRDLADRDDCAARRILDNAVVVIVPVQNPDGREADSRRNVYGFDMNRDWFARTQPETDGKLALLQDYPPVLFIDAHEMGGTSYFFPPNADPFHHEIAEPTVDWINNVYGAAMAAEFTRRGIDFFNRNVYDMFYMGYGDTAPTTGFLSAGMTFEKGGDSPIAERTEEQYLTQWVSLSAAAARRTALLEQWHGMHVDAFRQGGEGRLEPNKVYNPGNEVITRVPDRLVRHYFLYAGDRAKAREVATVVRRLQRMGVAVRRLVLPLTVPDYRAHGRAPARVTLPAGTYWVPMAQAQKHWIQAILGEDSYPPFPYFYDVTGWSMPLLANISGGSSGALLRPIAVPASPVPAPTAPPGTLPPVGVLQLSTTSTAAIESTGWLRYLLERVWRVPHRLLTPADVASGGLTGLGALLVPNGPADAAQDALGATGAAALRTWVDGGGRYVGWRGGTALAARLGVTTAVLTPSTSAVPGTLFRVRVAPSTPLGSGVGGTAWQFYQSGTDTVMRASDPAHAAASYPAAGSPDWFVSGFALGAEELAGTAAVVDEPFGRGRAVLFAGEPNFRAFTDGTAKILFNAIAAPSAPAPAGSAAERSAARQAAAALPSVESPIAVHVAPAHAAEVTEILDRFDARWTERRVAGRVAFLVDNPDGLSADEHPWAAQLPSALRHAGVVPLAVTLP